MGKLNLKKVFAWFVYQPEVLVMQQGRDVRLLDMVTWEKVGICSKISKSLFER